MSSENVTKVFSSLPTVFDFADWLSTQGRVSSDNELFIDLLQRVRHDVTEASRLYTSQAVVDYLESWPDKRTYIDKVLQDIERVLNDIGQFVEAVRVSGDDGSTVSLRRKFQWAISHQKKLRSKQQLLTICHQSLMPAVQLMQTVEMNATFDPIHELPDRPWVGDTVSGFLKSPRSRQKSKFAQRNSSVPSITLSEPDLKDDKFAHPYQHILAELPGSTPDDLHRQSLDLYAGSRKSRSNSMEEVLQASARQSNMRSTLESDVVEESRRPMTADADVAAAPRRSPPKSPSTRRSVDQVRPSLSFFDNRARASFDSARPRAYSEQMRPQRSFEMRSRLSYDQVRPLPTVTERPIERFNSTASVAVGDAISIPLMHMRYQTRHINVRKPPVKQNSLPSTLPSFPSQTSLMDDLNIGHIITDRPKLTYQLSNNATGRLRMQHGENINRPFADSQIHPSSTFEASASATIIEPTPIYKPKDTIFTEIRARCDTTPCTESEFSEIYTSDVFITIFGNRFNTILKGERESAKSTQ
ncbi:uncharacterized protein CC84DRAFT_1218093 [Paraphaeosphaeria sporulosa]|uniref:Uncharacterized protein n=1 Tax=Paraphaeosphaeria sporulosa TaxID=1460663 RepID=A0A177CAH9_9PLEO|nr:uncharacterized protein CC84DRAFT_1218093 [Paraphaeosphaeria sporulosa]OAG04663.1 hypothetical protein CC84DRAFT_1218093 [Paraphaeosphaeria sporulosa]